ncbi:MAG: hypothetical protein WDN30_07725 [Pararobbsia sp.]
MERLVPIACSRCWTASTDKRPTSCAGSDALGNLDFRDGVLYAPAILYRVTGYSLAPRVSRANLSGQKKTNRSPSGRVEALAFTKYKNTFLKP